MAECTSRSTPHNLLVPLLGQGPVLPPIHRGLGPLDPLALELVVDLGILPRVPAHHGLEQVVGHVFDAALPTAKVEQHAGAHDTPPQAGPVGHGAVDVGHVGDAFLHQVHDLAHQRRLQPVGHVPDHLLLDMHRLLAHVLVEAHRPADRFLGRLLPAHHLHERDEVWRVERVAYHHPLRFVLRLKPLLDARARQPAAARRDYGVWADEMGDLAEEFLLEV
ncbi:hypothetical protein PpBr36_04554 [Pyricularia pennisetigena]|uniref:hypothetical protein n=1 Tax=Pyricularia pennisetigena TaxID=1578925 RepID=UPI00114F941B|nr:hypothetical protein PpBr36_04554 [Pyricularia pennisetigena]TLS27036.1 hypothetical protein PpBr36_04554 [Pyricularia pennisetigena]